MCDTHGHETEFFVPDSRSGVLNLGDELEIMRFLADAPELRSSSDGMQGYNQVGSGQRVLVATDTLYDPDVAQIVAHVLRERGARVDEVVVDVGPDREFTEVDEIEVVMRKTAWRNDPRRYEGIAWVEDLGHHREYDLVVMGRGGPVNTFPTDFRYELIPWFEKRQMLEPAVVYPRELHMAINRKVHELFQVDSRGGRVRLQDAEGTDLSWPMYDEYYGPDNSYWLTDDPVWSHIMSHPSPPFIKKEDGSGIIAGTINHFSCPFPHIQLEIEGGQVVDIAGGGGYGDAWRELLNETRNIQYPGFPRPGLFYLWESAIGTNPHIRPEPVDRMQYWSSGGVEKERMRSGFIHMGLGSPWRGIAEEWAGEVGEWHGHLHVHLSFANLTIETRKGEDIPVIVNGRLVALDDPEIRHLASHVGDPDYLLDELWKPAIPGISSSGDYWEDYARDPKSYVYAGKRDADLWDAA